MEFDLLSLRRGNFIISKQMMKEHFGMFDNLEIIFNKKVVGRRYKFPDMFVVFAILRCCKHLECTLWI